MFACKGCEGFLCTLRAGHGDVCGDEDVAQLWWDNHGLTRIFKDCSNSAHEPILCEEHVNGCYVCPFHVCRRRYSKNVVLSTKAKVGVSTCLKVMFGYANGDRMDCITQDAHITKNTTTKFVQRLEAILAWYMRFCTEKQACQVKNMQVDETCFGKRKCKVGKPVSGHGQTWFQVAVETSRDGGPTERVFVKHLPNRRASSLSPLVTGLRHRYGIVRTDAWRGSMCLTREIGQFHRVCNHDVGFVSRCPNSGELVHTNNAESANSLLKSEARRRFRIGKRGEQRRNRVEAYGVLVNGKLKNRQSTPFIEVLQAVREATEQDPAELS